jgi:ATP-dependent DNA helicase RecG
MLKIADLNRDADLLEYAKSKAEALLNDYPSAVEQHLDRWLGHVDELVKV